MLTKNESDMDCRQAVRDADMERERYGLQRGQTQQENCTARYMDCKKWTATEKDMDFKTKKVSCTD